MLSAEPDWEARPTEPPRSPTCQELCETPGLPDVFSGDFEICTKALSLELECFLIS